MKSKYIIAAAVVTLGTVAAGFAGNYKVSVTLPEELDETAATLINYDTGATIDSLEVTDCKVTFTGNIGEPLPARLIVDGNRLVSFILEDGEIVIDGVKRTVDGGALNKINEDFAAQTADLQSRFRQAADEQEQEAIYARYVALTDSVMNANVDNPVGYFLFLDKAYDFEPAKLQEYVDSHPYFKKFERVERLLDANRKKMATSEGSKFVDFEIEYDGVSHKLSDVVGKGDYVLVDFWASWCGPCIRQTAVLKDIYNEYKDKGLKILGVAVWDEPANTLRAIQQHELPWESWLNGQTVPTDAYGISGIPCIILFGPDGTILSRDKQDDELRAAVAAAMNAAK